MTISIQTRKTIENLVKADLGIQNPDIHVKAINANGDVILLDAQKLRAQ